MTTVQRKTRTRAAPARHTPAAPLVMRRAAAAPRVQTSTLRVSSPRDPAEKEAESVGRKVARMPLPARGGWESPYVARFAGSGVLPAAERTPEVPAKQADEIRGAAADGQPLPPGVRAFMEPRFRADFRAVRIHTDDRAAALSRDLHARAFTVGNQIFFGRGHFQPETAEGRELIAHELTHTIQQGSVVQRAEDVSVTQRSPRQVQRGIVSEALDYIADKANHIPGFRMFTLVLGVNPINMSRVERSGANLLRALIEFIPFGGLITQALDRYGAFERAGAWVEQMIGRLGMTGAAIKKAILDFIDDLGWTDAVRPWRVWSRAKRIFTDPIDRIIGLAKEIGAGIVKIIKDAILRPLAGLARGTRGYDLLRAILAEDPITHDPYPRTPDTLIGGFMKLIGQEEVWENIKRAKAAERAWGWFRNALGELMAFVGSIPRLFIHAVTSLQLTDIIVLPRAWTKVAGVFFAVAGRFVSWAGSAVWNLLEIVFDVVSPGALRYIKKTGKALRSILRDPFPFVRNLVRAAKLGFTTFATRFPVHLKTGLIEWLTGSLPGVYIPRAFSLPELVKFVFSVLGIGWTNVRLKLVKVVGEPVARGLESAFDFVASLVRNGPAAAWEKIREQLGNLQDTVIGGITDFVVDTVVKKAIPKFIAMFVPGAGFISAILSIYDTLMVFVRKISKIVQVVTGFVDSIAAIAAGAVTAAAGRVEGILGGLLSLAISFLAGFAGLGNVADRVMGVIGKVRAVVDRAIDALVAWIVATGRKLFAALFGKKEEKADESGDNARSRAVKAKVGAELRGKTLDSADDEAALIDSVYRRYTPEGLKTVRFVPSQSRFGALDVVVSASAAEEVAQLNLKTPDGAKTLGRIAGQMSVFAGRTTIRVYHGTDNRFFEAVTQARGRAGHAELRLRNRLPVLLERIRRQERTLQTPLATPVAIHLDINRTPCDGCATSHLQSLLRETKAAYPDVPFTLTISSASVSRGAQITTEKGLIALLASGVELTASAVWTEIRKQMRAHGIQQIDYGNRTYDIDDVNEFIANAQEVQALIDRAVFELNRSRPRPATRP